MSKFLIAGGAGFIGSIIAGYPKNGYGWVVGYVSGVGMGMSKKEKIYV